MTLGSDLNSKGIANIYSPLVGRQVSRLLGLLDRTPASPTYGCFDRNYWHLKIVTDFPGATYQQGVLSLAWLVTQTSERFCGLEHNQGVEWARAGMRFWESIQNRDGSFNEWYDREHGYCPTAFTTFAVSEALILLSERLPAIDVTIIKCAIENASRWLSIENNILVANQNMAALNALHNAWTITGNNKFQHAAEQKLKFILQTQDPEGWFPEYGGADLGYSFVATDLLAHYWMKTRDDRVYQALERILQFLSSFIQPDGTVSDCGSRGTRHALPYGLELLAHYGNPTAERVLSAMHWAIRRERSLTPDHVDDRYFVYFYINSYIGAFHKCFGGHVEWEGLHKKSIKYKNAGLGVFSTGSLITVISFKRNSMLRIFVDNTLVYSDAGYHLGLNKGRQGWSCGFDSGQSWSMSGDDDLLVIRTSGKFYGALPVQMYVIPLKVWGYVALRSSKIAAWFNSWLKSRKVASPMRIPILMEREVRLKDSQVIVIDRIILQQRLKISELSLVEESNVTHSPSAGFYVSSPQRFLSHNINTNELIAALVLRGETTVTKVFSVDEERAPMLKVEWQ